MVQISFLLHVGCTTFPPSLCVDMKHSVFAHASKSMLEMHNRYSGFAMPLMYIVQFEGLLIYVMSAHHFEHLIYTDCDNSTN